mmetsp:Transcript_26855/g.77701  ORF Transcript_26855/g.77701 Transcript_26855/m.77701 type:complete len:230 (-) Transcript_26855:31-720(-)
MAAIGGHKDRVGVKAGLVHIDAPNDGVDDALLAHAGLPEWPVRLVAARDARAPRGELADGRDMGRLAGEVEVPAEDDGVHHGFPRADGLPKGPGLAVPGLATRVASKGLREMLVRIRAGFVEVATPDDLVQSRGHGVAGLPEGALGLLRRLDAGVTLEGAHELLVWVLAARVDVSAEEDGVDLRRAAQTAVRLAAAGHEEFTILHRLLHIRHLHRRHRVALQSVRGGTG